ncbi:MAG TPA: glucose 1-dehydrogenase [Calditrichia bacterium]|nr:glucose 1-dehydrogenase [Calditrichia bacterium]
MMNRQFSGKVVLLTGASSGIGMATANHLCESGASLMLHGRSGERLKELAGELQAPERVKLHIGDLRDAAYRTALVADTIKAFGKLDVLINNAGIIGSAPLTAMDMGHYDEMMNINLQAPIHLTQLAIPHLEKTSGNVVNVSSVAGLRAFPGIMAYCVSKAGVDQFTRCAALELAPKGIRINAVNPGVVQTKLHLNSGMSDEAYQAFLEHSTTTHPMGRVGQPEEVAQLICFLSSTQAGWITGGTYSIDGGRAQTCAR